VVSTRKLVDTLDEQQLLEEMIDRAKPPAPTGKRFERLHYLLSTPFRYPPLRHGSRFARRDQRSPWYGSERLETALAETAFYRLVFLAGSPGLGPLEVELTTFSAGLRTKRGVDLGDPELAELAVEVSSPTDYSVAHEIGARLREVDAELCLYRSARDPGGGRNAAVFSPEAFSSPSPRNLRTWHCRATREAVEFVSLDRLRRQRRCYRRAEFEVDGVLPQPAP